MQLTRKTARTQMNWLNPHAGFSSAYGEARYPLAWDALLEMI